MPAYPMQGKNNSVKTAMCAGILMFEESFDDDWEEDATKRDRNVGDLDGRTSIGSSCLDRSIVSLALLVPFAASEPCACRLFV